VLIKINIELAHTTKAGLHSAGGFNVGRCAVFATPKRNFVADHAQQ
jgi:hypothetical protein